MHFFEICSNVTVCKLGNFMTKLSSAIYDASAKSCNCDNIHILSCLGADIYQDNVWFHIFSFSYSCNFSVTVSVIVFLSLCLFWLVILHKICISM